MTARSKRVTAEYVRREMTARSKRATAEYVRREMATILSYVFC
jgi:hypothetical protein